MNKEQKLKYVCRYLELNWKLYTNIPQPMIDSLYDYVSRKELSDE